MKEKIQELINELNYHTKLYDEGKPEWTDKEWDDKYFELVMIENETGIILPDSPTQKVNWDAVSALTKVTHNHLMLSLAKSKSVDEVKSFIGDKEYLAMAKMDGLTCSLKYNNGRLISAETRGNGEVGEDILHNARVIVNLPLNIPYKDELIIDGEIICDYETFEGFANDYKNPRNFASGKIRSLDPRECSRAQLSFIAWDCISSTADTLMDKLLGLKDLGFEVVPFSFYHLAYPTLEDEIEWIKEVSVKHNYPIDGVVFKYNNCEYYNSLGKTEHHFRGGLAFKFYDEEYDTELLEITYDVSRTGLLTPVAVFKPVEIDGTTVERASLHNYSIMKEILGRYPDLNQPIKVIKSNMIIPQVVSAEYRNNQPHNHIIFDAMSCTCPICGSIVEIIESESGVENLVCPNEQCEGKLVQRLDHFCGKKGLDIKGLSRATLEKLIDWGWLGNIREIFSLSNFREEWVKKPGFGVKSVDNILNAIESARNVKFANVISAFGIPLIGSTVAKDLTKRFKNYAEFRKAIEDDFDFSKFDGYGYEMNKSLQNFDYAEMDDVVWNCLNLEYEAEKEIIENNITGKIFAITGKSKFGGRPKVKELIQSYGGHVGDHVTVKTNYLLCNKPENTSKYNNAQKFGTIIITDEDLEKMING